MKEVEIIDKAIKKLHKIAGVQLEYKHQSGVKQLADGLITIATTPKIILNVEIKNEIRQSHLPYLLERKKSEKDKFIVVCRYIPMPVKNILKEEKINYLETAGNCYIQVKSFLIYINDQKVTKERETGKSRIWNTAGLKFVFAIFHNPDLLNQPYRTIANAASVGLGTVGTLMEDFQKEGFVKQGKRDDQTILFLERRDELINKWATIYNTVLKPKQFVGRFSVAGNSKLKDEKLPDGILWGGEMAGAKLTKFLKPEKIQLYISLQKTAAMKLLKIVPDANGNIELLNIFWNNEIASEEQKETQTVPPLIAYADLLSSHDSRNYETAERIKSKYLER